MRTTGLWVGRLKRSFSNIKAEVEREIGADEIRRQLHNERILDLEREMKQSIMPPPASNPAATPPSTPSEGAGQPANAASSSPGDTVTPAANPPAPSNETAQPLRSDRPSEP